MLLPETYEWPAGWTSNIVMTPEGFYIVPHTPAGRIQLYDAGMQFIRGWPVDAGGGVFKLLPFDAANQQVGVVTARKNLKFVYDIEGNLLSRASYSPARYDAYPTVGVSLWVPTRFWLLPLSSPMIAWLMGASGMLGLYFLRRVNS